MGRAFWTVIGLAIAAATVLSVLGLVASWIARWRSAGRLAAEHAKDAVPPADGAEVRSRDAALRVGLAAGRIRRHVLAATPAFRAHRLALLLAPVGFGLFFAVCAVAIPFLKHHDRRVSRCSRGRTAETLRGAFFCCCG